MTYGTIRRAALKDKESHFYECMAIHDFDDFAVCVSDKITIIVDSDIAGYVANRKWCEDSHGYAVANIEGETIRLHDFVMAFHNKEKPEGLYIDHINRDKKDNRLTNLRFVTPYENTLNLSLRRTSNTGVTGVCKTRNDKYRAYITYNGKQINLGYYKTLEEARVARIEGEQRFGYKNRPTTLAEKCNLAFLAELEVSDD